MKISLLLPLSAAVVLAFASCGKQSTEAERQAQVDREVQARLDAEHQAQAQKDLAQRQADLDARERALARKEVKPAATPAPTAAQPARQPVFASDDDDGGSYATFYRKLDPYGDWMETATYGYVFQPRQATQSRNWRPYTNGHWVYTDAGWTWLSEEQFGWATYHYGRWVRLRDTGWVWVPGDEWAPAWVSWRKGNDYVGWAPLPPEARFDHQTGIRNWADSHYDIGPEQYTFVAANEFGGPQSSRVIVPAERNVTIINQTTNITNITYNNSTVVDRGPSYEDLRGRSRYQIQRLKLERTQSFNNEQPVLRGEVVAMPARNLRPADRNARPPRVQKTIAQPTIEREATAPAGLPKQVVRPAVPTPTIAVQPIVRPTVTPQPTATVAAAPSAQPSPNPQDERLERMKKNRRLKRQGNPPPEVSPSPESSATATPAQPSPTPKGRHQKPRPNQP